MCKHPERSPFGDADVNRLAIGSDYLRFLDLNHEDREVLEVLSEDFVLFVPFVVENLR